MAVTASGDRGEDPAARLVAYAVAQGLIAEPDRRWAYNVVLEAVGASGPAALQAAAGSPDRGSAPAECTPGEGRAQSAAVGGRFYPDCLLRPLAVAAHANGVLRESPDNPTAFERFSARLMGRLMPPPSHVAREFARREQGDPRAATDWFYQLCCAADYVRTSAIARNVRWQAPTTWGNLEITINRSKPEKDPRDIARAAGLAVGGASAPAGESPSPSESSAAPAAPAYSAAPAPYPRCRLCAENEGYAGRLPQSAADDGWPARQNLRMVPLTLGGSAWALQYSPYAYFDEHCIVLNLQHVPMHVDRGNMARLLEFVQRFPHYFLGSNADLPIVGGSILSHDHFQGGRHVFPLMEAPIAQSLSWPEHAHVQAGIVRWPISVIRLQCPDADALLDAADAVACAWRGYRDARAGIIPYDADGTRHNTVTPIAYRRGNDLVMDLALRCNITSREHPLGVFHPHRERHHIKKENIGLIEVMGLAILPPRLEPQMAALAQALAGGVRDAALLQRDPLCAPHAAWAQEVASRHDFAVEDVRDVLRREVGAVFARVLEDAGVFKWDAAGRAAQDAFLRTFTRRP
ncbi:MAG: galactose-1-phosphate uridylyltransferase [Eggerthellaceae bacterium]|jgi:UDPglucose--hexose-1-phosphate uridylyltransferase